MRTGTYVTLGAVKCFDPKPLPPEPPVRIDGAIAAALSEADRALARLDGATLTLPDPDLFVYAFMRQEAVLSSQIEGTQASLDDLLEFESGATSSGESDVGDIVNYLNAIRWALDELGRLPLSLRLIRGAHQRLLREGRGAERAPGEFRRNQNWIGPAGCSLEEASFVPPAVPLMERALDDLERFFHETSPIPPLIRFGLIHAQFETIHPFWDGNGRLGRMLVTLLLCAEGVLHRPVLYLSLFFKANREEYYSRLQATRDRGDVEGWLLFFLRGIKSVSEAALDTARRINALRERMLTDAPAASRSNKAYAVLNAMFRRPYATVNFIAEALAISFPTANAIIGDLVRAGILVEVTGGARHRVFAFKPYLDVLHEAIGDLSGVVGNTDPLVTEASIS